MANKFHNLKPLRNMAEANRMISENVSRANQEVRSSMKKALDPKPFKKKKK